MRNSSWKKGLVIGIITLFLGTGVFPSVSGNIVTHKNTQDVVDSQKLDDSDKLFRLHIDRQYFFGRIYNLTIDEDDKYYEFTSYKLRIFHFYIYSIHYWGITYEREVGGLFIRVGYNFRGLLTPTFICGYFYPPWS